MIDFRNLRFRLKPKTQKRLGRLETRANSQYELLQATIRQMIANRSDIEKIKKKLSKKK